MSSITVKARRNWRPLYQIHITEIKTNPPRTVIHPPSGNLIRLATRNADSTVNYIPTITNVKIAGSPLKLRYTDSRTVVIIIVKVTDRP